MAAMIRRKPHIWLVVISLLTGVMFLALAAARRVYVLRADDCINLATVETTDGKLRITGSIFHSGLGVGKIETVHSGTRIVVRVYLVPAGTGSRREFSSVIPLEGDVRQVWLGEPPNTVTWFSFAGHPLHFPAPSGSRGGAVIWVKAG